MPTTVPPPSFWTFLDLHLLRVSLSLSLSSSMSGMVVLVYLLIVVEQAHHKPTFDLRTPSFFSASAECVGLGSGSESLLELISWGSERKDKMMMMYVWRLTQPQKGCENI